MNAPRVVKHLLLLALASGCAGRAAASAAPASPSTSAREGGAATPARADAPRRQTLVAPTAAEIDAIRPLLARGPAFVVRNPDGGADARISLITRGHVPMAMVHRAVSTPGEYMTFMPILRSVDVLSEHGTRVGFRFHVAAPLFDVTALCGMHIVSPRRIDVEITESETGPGGSRWDLFDDGAERTVVALTTWGDPSQGHWLLRQVARRSPSAIAGMNISVDTVLGLGAVRRAEVLAGRNLPMRPAEGSVAHGELEPPTMGAWGPMLHDATLVTMRLTPEGAVQQVTAAAWTPAEPAQVIERLRDVNNHTHIWGSLRQIDVVPSVAGDPAGSVRTHVVIETPLSRLEGEQVMRWNESTVWQDGVGGDFADAPLRWDVQRDPTGGSVVMLTGGSDVNRAGWITRALMQRDPWLMAGFAGSWKIVWLRHLLRGM